MRRLFQLTGANGSGKTNLLRILGKSPQLASLLFPLEVLRDISVRSTAIGFQAGQNVIFSRSVRSLLTTPLVFAGMQSNQAGSRVAELLRRFDFTYLIDRDYLTLSGGERQFVALFSCLFSKVDLFLLDDPVVMMDKERTAKILDVIDECMKGDARLAYGITSVRPEYYADLKPHDIIHLGYSPNADDCLGQFDSLLSSLKDTGKKWHGISLDEVTIAPYKSVLLSQESQQWQPNEIVLLTGANGSGKSCLLHTMAGVLKPSSGSISMVDDRGRRTHPVSGKNCFYLPQQFTSLLGFAPLSQELGLNTGARWWWKEMLTFLFDWRIVNPVLRVPEASLGEKHFSNILAVIAALASNTDVAVLLLDEPDSGLDALHCQLLAKLLAWLRSQNYFVMVVSHHPSVYRDGARTDASLREFTISNKRLVSHKVTSP